MNPLDPGAPDGMLPADAMQPKPWQKQPPQPPQQPQDNSGSGNSDNGVGDLVDASVEGASAGLDILGGVADVAGGVLEATGEAAGAALEGLGGCADGCSGCSLAVLLLLFATASTAMAVWR